MEKYNLAEHLNTLGHKFVSEKLFDYLSQQ